MHGIQALERAEIEQRVRRLSSAIIAGHAHVVSSARQRRTDHDARSALREHVDAGIAIARLLTATHPLRMTLEHAASVHKRWEADPSGEALSMTLAMALLDRVLDDTAPSFRAPSEAPH